MERIKRNPYITQNELANELHLSRSAVAGYISALMKKRNHRWKSIHVPRRRINHLHWWCQCRSKSVS
nr:winged helix-turn-helix transcriptional regulator [Geomicrobium sp. JCM 19055]